MRPSLPSSAGAVHDPPLVHHRDAPPARDMPGKTTTYSAACASRSQERPTATRGRFGGALVWLVAAACATPAGSLTTRPPTAADQGARAQPEDVAAAARVASKPDITDPGPDFGFIPNSIQIVQPGRVYLETGAQRTESGDRSTRTLQTPILLRVGAVKSLELRAQMNAIVRQDGTSSDVTGHGPLTLGFKYRFGKGRVGEFIRQGTHGIRRRRDHQGFLRPSIGIEGEFTLPLASAGLDSGKVEPTLTLNADHFVTETGTLTWNIGAAGPVDDTGRQHVQGILSTAWSQFIAEPVQAYLTGEYRAPTSDAGGGSVGRVGTGVYWYASQRVVLFGAFNWGLTDEALATDATVGVAFAF